MKWAQEDTKTWFCTGFKCISNEFHTSDIWLRVRFWISWYVENDKCQRHTKIFVYIVELAYSIFLQTHLNDRPLHMYQTTQEKPRKQIDANKTEIQTRK